MRPPDFSLISSPQGRKPPLTTGWVGMAKDVIFRIRGCAAVNSAAGAEEGADTQSAHRARNAQNRGGRFMMIS